MSEQMNWPSHHRRRGQSLDGRLSWSAVLGVEIVAGFFLLALLCAMAVNFGATAITKAKIVNIWPDFRAYRTELVEQMAVTGDGFSIDAPASLAAAVQENQLTAADDIETALAFRRPTIGRQNGAALAQTSTPNASAGASLAGGLIANATKRAQSEGRNFSGEVIDRSVVFKFDLGGRPYVMAITPAAIGQGVPGSLLWLCGRRPPPAGWYRLPGPSGSDLPDELSYSLCRDHRTF